MFAAPAIMATLTASELFTPSHLQQARFVASLAKSQPDLCAALTALTALAVSEGHVCLALDEGQTRERLAQWGLCLDGAAGTGVISGPQGPGPLIVQGQRLYFQRFFRDEQTLGQAILQRLHAASDNLELATASADKKANEPDWQQVAVFAALRQKFCVISGGPGTGKTFVVARILQQAALRYGPDFVIGLAAPTGKAASRLNDSLAQAFADETSPAPACLPASAQTVHRLLGWQGKGFRHHAHNPLALDMLVVDEASMLDLELTARLVEALPLSARLILLGDRNQLASVEAGAVLANLCAGQENRFSLAFAKAFAGQTGIALPVTQAISPLTDHVVELRHGRRFAPDSGIARLGERIRQGQAQEAGQFLEQPQADITRLEPRQFTEFFAPFMEETFGTLATITDPAQALAILQATRLLSPVRHGPQGSETLNRLAQELLTGSRIRETRPWYAGRPVMIRENDARLGLFNGDVGIALPDQGRLGVFFTDPAGGFVVHSPACLPRHETCYAMTVHKSQGSEFDHAVLILPENVGPILSRELLYTALTRAKRHFTLMGDVNQVVEAVARPMRRDSGLAEFLNGA